MNAEQQRLAENNKDERWHLWGPYLAERAWGTVREDYSANGDAWTAPDEHRRSTSRGGEADLSRGEAERGRVFQPGGDRSAVRTR